MEIMEIYKAPQGEGRNIGVPSIFIRLQGCPVHCGWCDIKQSWAMRTSESKTMTPQEVVARVDVLSNQEISHVVITGGEPMMQRKEVERLVLGLQAGYHVEIETSGIYRPLVDAHPQYNVSPKLPSAQPKVAPSDILELYLQEDAVFKFVVSNREDFEAARFLCDRYQIPYSRVILMPQGIDKATIIKGMSDLENQILQEWPQVKMTTRLHILMHDNERKR